MKNECTRLQQAIDEAAQQADQRALAFADQQILHRHLFEQTIGAGGELRGRAGDTNAVCEFARAHDAIELAGGTGQGRGPALPPQDETQQQHDRNGERNGQGP